MIDSDKHLLDDFQHDFPLVARPFAAIAERLDMVEQDVIDAYERLSEGRYISRIGAVIKPHAVGVSTLAAMRVPAKRLEEVADIVSGFEDVNHNYEREHTFNLWFVVMAANRTRLAWVLHEIYVKTGIKIMSLPMIEDYHLDLGFPIRWT